ncbi:hypothetical protein FACS1894120_4660 [Clostridia bacterium]|nr:hypothetical protein FACS1894120_4660 [Clostridia bacterium]
MVNILLSDYDISKKPCVDALSKYLRRGMKVTVPALSFRERDVTCEADWQKLYGCADGKPGVLRGGIEKTFLPYGIRDFYFINYFSDTAEKAAAAVKACDLLYLPWGTASLFMTRILEKGLYHYIEKFSGVVVGVGAGAQIQLATYHFTPGKDYPDFGFSQGVRFIEGYDVELHYDGTPQTEVYAQKAAMESKNTVLAIEDGSGVIFDGGVMTHFGNVYGFKAKG